MAGSGTPWRTSIRALAGNVQAALWRQAGYKVSQEVAQEIDAVLVRTLRYLLYLLTMTPPRRLLLPRSRPKK